MRFINYFKNLYKAIKFYVKYKIDNAKYIDKEYLENKKFELSLSDIFFIINMKKPKE